jgi:hypothetical protein
MKRTFILSLVGVAALLAGCATVPMAPSSADATAKTFQTTPGKANVYIFRDETFGAAIHLPLAVDGKPIGSTAAKTYFLETVDPGSHTISSGDSKVTIDTQAGHNYFIWQEVKMGVVVAHAKLHVVDEAKGEAGVRNCTLAAQ